MKGDPRTLRLHISLYLRTYIYTHICTQENLHKKLNSLNTKIELS